MRSLDESRTRWRESQRDGGDIAALQRAVKFNGPSSPCEAGCRSVCWKAFLLFRNAAASDRNLILREAREDYESFRGRYLQFIRHPELLAELTLDPLADDPESPWDVFRRDEIVRAEILQDVRRLPDDPFYHQESIQALILDVLFVFCKQNPDGGGYRQGMHELLAPIVYVLNQDAIDGHDSLLAVESTDTDMIEMLDGRFVEHDAYALFSKIMEKAKAFYETGSAPTSSTNTNDSAPLTELLSALAPANSVGGVEESAIVELSKEIHEGTLMRVDPELALHLKNIEILPQIFLIRWIRLLFGREFPFEQHLILWDSIFAFDPNLHLVPLICVAMLLRIRWQLLDADYSVALQSLLKYQAPQPPHGPQTFVDDAVFLRDHLDAAGGANLILKYTGRPPTRVLSPQSSSPGSTSRPSTPAAAFAAGLGSLRSRTLRVARSPLRPAKQEWDTGEAPITETHHTTSPSPSRFIQSRGNVEALFQGAAKGVLERGEKLGINQAVRGAVGEIRRNMAQSFQEAKQAAKQAHRVPSSGGADLFSPSSGNRRLSYGQAMRVIAEMERRNQQLATMLDETVTSLKSVANATRKEAEAFSSESSETEKGAAEKVQQQQRLEAVELAAAKVQFVKVYLEDASLILPPDEPTADGLAEDSPMSLPEKEATTIDNSSTDLMPAAEIEATLKPPQLQSEAADADNSLLTTSVEVKTADEDRMDMDEEDQSGGLTSNTPPSAPLEPHSPATVTQEPPQPTPTIPTRSTLAQSSFSWMLEPGDTASSANNNSRSSSTSTNNASSSAPSKNSSSRPSPAGRSRHAFLFGEVVGQSPLCGGGSSGGDPLADTRPDVSDGRSRSITSDEIFGLEPLRRALPRDKE